MTRASETIASRRVLTLGFEGIEDRWRAVEWLIESGYLAREPPRFLSLPCGTRMMNAEAAAAWSARRVWSSVRFSNGSYIHADAKGGMDFEGPLTELNPRNFLARLAALTFRHGSAGPMHDSWFDEHPPGPGLPVALGWAAFFQGEGHQVLVSRRWLDHGPWRVLRGANDTTLVQFHDLEASSEEAFAQAKPGHEWLMGSDTDWAQRGHIPNNVFIREEVPERLESVRAMYVPEDRTLRIVVHGRPVPRDEMLFACHARAYGLGEDYGPIDAVRYIFPEERAARAHLPDLWLRELECWTFDEAGNEVRIDEDFHLEPPPKPEWVRRLDEGG